MKNIQYYEKADSKTQQAYLKIQCNCVLCNTTLEIKFETISVVEVKEEAHCPQCEIRTRAKIHVIH